VLIKFYWLREQPDLRKKPSTSELVDWISALLRSGISIDRIEAHIPFVGALLKKEQDVDAVMRYDQQGGKYRSGGPTSAAVQPVGTDVPRSLLRVRAEGVPLSLQEWQTFLRALEEGLHGSSLLRFYIWVARVW